MKLIIGTLVCVLFTAMPAMADQSAYDQAVKVCSDAKTTMASSAPAPITEDDLSQLTADKFPQLNAEQFSQLKSRIASQSNFARMDEYRSKRIIAQRQLAFACTDQFLSNVKKIGTPEVR